MPFNRSSSRFMHSKKSRSWLSKGEPDKPGAAAERVRLAAAGKQANAEMMAKFAPLTAANAKEALDWQEARIRELQEQKQ